MPTTEKRRFGRRNFDDPRPTDANRLVVSERHVPRGNQKPQPLPLPTGKSPYRLDLADILPASRMNAIAKARKLVFHVGADTGGIKRPEAQRLVASHMLSDFDTPAGDQPSFFYHVGDVIYFYGEPTEYFPQFYDPYSDYPAPIFAIPGNHDGDMSSDHPAPSLDAFVRNFCAPAPVVTPDAGEATRDAMTQPNVYWTLLTPYATVIGLYTNVPEGGYISDDQKNWLTEEMKSASKATPLILALHHPIYSADAHHGGSKNVGDVVDEAIDSSKRLPHLVLTGHVHNYQRFTRKVGNRQVPYLVTGASGYWHLHSMAAQVKVKTLPLKIPGSDVTLESYCDDRHGFLKLSVSNGQIHGEYYTVPRPHESWRAPSSLLDAFDVDLEKYSVRTLLAPAPAQGAGMADARRAEHR